MRCLLFSPPQPPAHHHNLQPQLFLNDENRRPCLPACTDRLDGNIIIFSRFNRRMALYQRDIAAAWLPIARASPHIALSTPAPVPLYYALPFPHGVAGGCRGSLRLPPPACHFFATATLGLPLMPIARWRVTPAGRATRYGAARLAHRSRHRCPSTRAADASLRLRLPAAE